MFTASSSFCAFFLRTSFALISLLPKKKRPQKLPNNDVSVGKQERKEPFDSPLFRLLCPGKATQNYPV